MPLYVCSLPGRLCPLRHPPPYCFLSLVSCTMDIPPLQHLAFLLLSELRSRPFFGTLVPSAMLVQVVIQYVFVVWLIKSSEGSFLTRGRKEESVLVSVFVWIQVFAVRLPAVWPWTSHPTLQSLRFLVWKIRTPYLGTKIHQTSEMAMRISMISEQSRLFVSDKVKVRFKML